MSEWKTYRVKFDPNYPCFGLIGEPHEHKQHQNQQAGIDLYVHVVNFDTGERCHKKLYVNKSGLHFKHTGYSPMYLAHFVSEAEVCPFQVDPLPSPLHTSREKVNGDADKVL